MAGTPRRDSAVQKLEAERDAVIGRMSTKEKIDWYAAQPLFHMPKVHSFIEQVCPSMMKTYNRAVSCHLVVFWVEAKAVTVFRVEVDVMDQQVQEFFTVLVAAQYRKHT